MLRFLVPYENLQLLMGIQSPLVQASLRQKGQNSIQDKKQIGTTDFQVHSLQCSLAGPGRATTTVLALHLEREATKSFSRVTKKHGVNMIHTQCWIVMIISTISDERITYYIYIAYSRVQHIISSHFG